MKANHQLVKTHQLHATSPGNLLSSSSMRSSTPPIHLTSLSTRTATAHGSCPFTRATGLLSQSSLERMTAWNSWTVSVPVILTGQSAVWDSIILSQMPAKTSTRLSVTVQSISTRASKSRTRMARSNSALVVKRSQRKWLRKMRSRLWL